MTKGFSGKINVSGSLMISHKTWRKAAEQDMLNRRIVLDGYPVERPFETLEDVEKYLSGDKIVCLLCGKDYKSLSAHLKVHTHTSLSYKEHYRIPANIGLVGRNTFKKLSDAAKEGLASGRLVHGGTLIKGVYEAGKAYVRHAYKSVKEHANDVAKAERLRAIAVARKEKALEKLECVKGHPWNRMDARQCPTCAAARAKNNHNSPREISVITVVEVLCTDCKNPTTCKKISSTRKVLLCLECRRKRNNECSARRSTPEYRRQKYLKRKEKLAKLKSTQQD